MDIFEQKEAVTESSVTVSKGNDSPVLKLNHSSEKEQFKWSRKAVIRLLQLYKEEENLFKTLKRTVFKKDKCKVWEKVAKQLVQEGYNVTAEQCETKVMDLTRTYIENEKNSRQKHIPHVPLDL